MEKSNFRTTKKGGKKPNSTKQSFTQLIKKMDKLALPGHSGGYCWSGHEGKN
jgi:hypothetical protein